MVLLQECNLDLLLIAILTWTLQFPYPTEVNRDVNLRFGRT